jgi:hypothetical protein
MENGRYIMKNKNNLLISIASYIVGFFACFCVLLILAKYIGDRIGVKILYPKEYDSLLFVPTTDYNDNIEVISVESEGKKILRIKNFEDRYDFSILDTTNNETITYSYWKDGKTSITGQNWNYSADTNEFKMISSEAQIQNNE